MFVRWFASTASVRGVDHSASLRIRRALRTHAPELAGEPLRTLGHGLDNIAFLAGDLVVRAAEDPAGLHREANLLTLLAPRLPLPVPVPRFADGEGVLAYPLLPGRPLLGRTPAPGTARQLGGFLRVLHAIDPAEVAGLVAVEDADPGEWLAELTGPPELVRTVRATVAAAAPRRVLCHADLGAEHVLEQDGVVTGVIDWSDAALTDPALDFARLYRDFGPAFLAAALDAYGGLPGAGPRIEFFARCAALEDLAHGLESGQSAYAEAARRSFTWLFPDAEPAGRR
jgi:aminoglycoside phosphotransferase (APT) family kinase protein